MTQVPRYLTPAEAAEMLAEAGLDISADTTRRWAREGLVGAIRMPGGHYRIKRDELLAILNGDYQLPARAA